VVVTNKLKCVGNTLDEVGLLDMAHEYSPF